MGLRSKTVTIASALAGLAVFSQAPEFAQQYRQRIGGAVDELKTVVVDFDKDAANSEMSRIEALAKLETSNVEFAKDRGLSMTQTIGRFERLSEQQGWLEQSHPLTRPLFVLKNPDRQLINRAWEIYEPAVPLNTPGAMYGGLGALLTLLLVRFGISGGRRLAGKNSNKKLASETEDPKLIEASQTAPLSVDSDNMSVEIEDERYPVSEDLPTGRREHSQTRARGIPDAMQVAPVQRESVPYLRVNSDSDEVPTLREIHADAKSKIRHDKS